MGIFGRRRDEYDAIYDDRNDRSEPDENRDPEEAIDNIRGTIEQGDCLCCGGSNTMHHEGNGFICSRCKRGVDEKSYYRWAAGYPVEVETVYDESYEEVYDEDGDLVEVECNNCREHVRWKDGQYVCPNCGSIMSRADFFNCIGAEPPGPECLTCDNLYPGCIVCPHGYVEDDEF
ncbi:MAG: hypothetical protein RR475_02345 [Clostridia bacterium]